MFLTLLDFSEQEQPAPRAKSVWPHMSQVGTRPGLKCLLHFSARIGAAFVWKQAFLSLKDVAPNNTNIPKGTWIIASKLVTARTMCASHATWSDTNTYT